MVQMTEEQLEHERCVDDDYNVVNHYYRAKYMHPNIPFFLQDENGPTKKFDGITEIVSNEKSQTKEV